MNDSIINNLANDVVANKTNKELLELASKLCKDRKYFTNKEDFNNFLDKTLTKQEMMDFFFKSTIDEEAQEDKICVYIDEDTNKPTSCLICGPNETDEDWCWNISYHIQVVVKRKLRDKITGIIEDMMK